MAQQYIFFFQSNFMRMVLGLLKSKLASHAMQVRDDISAINNVIVYSNDNIITGCCIKRIMLMVRLTRRNLNEWHHNVI